MPDDYQEKSQRERLIGLGRRSISKSYYPELKQRLGELEVFRALLDNINDAIFIVDAASGTIADVSGAMRERFGCDPQTLIGRPFHHLLPGHISRFLQELFESESGLVRLETTLSCSADTPDVPVDISIQVPKGLNPRRAVIVARDISERKMAEEELRKINVELERRVLERTKELDKANQAKSEFLSVVSHELRTPLTSIIGFAKIIRKRLDRSVIPNVTDNHDDIVPILHKMAENLSVVISEGDRLTTLINDLLDMARLEAGHMEYYIARLNAEMLITRATDAVSGLMEHNGVELRVDLADNLPEIAGDSDRLLQVIINLLSNAVKYADGKPVKLKAEKKGTMLRIAVRDYGPGIPEHMRESVFDKFITQNHQAESSKNMKGTGLGLAICRHIVEAHGGSIDLRQPDSGGSEFYFTIPAAAPSRDSS